MGIVAMLRRVWAARASRRGVGRSTRGRRFRLVVETLEDRTAPSATNPATEQLLQSYGQIPLSFEANQGQTDAQVNFLLRGSGYALFLTPNEAVLSLQQQAAASGDAVAEVAKTSGVVPEVSATSATTPPSVLHMQLVGANAQPQVVGLDQQPGVSNYFIGNDPSQWYTGVANYDKVEYQDVYPGINLVYYGNQRQLEYDWVVAPGADPSVITLGFQGADSMALDAAGNLVLHTAGGDVIEHAPIVYQESGGIRQNVSGQFVLEGNGQVRFVVGAYDSSKPLIIDPVLSYSTYLGGSTQDRGGFGIAVDISGNAYVTGDTCSTDFPTADPLQPINHGGEDAFVAKLNASGTALVYSTYLGGSDQDLGYGIAVDVSGNAYVTGLTHSTDFPTANPLQLTNHGGDATWPYMWVMSSWPS